MRARAVLQCLRVRLNQRRLLLKLRGELRDFLRRLGHRRSGIRTAASSHSHRDRRSRRDASEALRRDSPEFFFNVALTCHLSPRDPILRAKSKTHPAFSPEFPFRLRRPNGAARETLPPATGFRRSQTTSDILLSAPFFAPTQGEARRAIRRAETRIAFSLPDRSSGKSRNPTRPGLQTGSGTRQSVFSFGFRYPALRANRVERFVQERFGPARSTSVFPALHKLLHRSRALEFLRDPMPR